MIPVDEIQNLGEAKGSIVPWKQDQLRCFIEKDDDLAVAWIRYIEDDHVLTLSTTSLPSSTDEAGDNVENSTQELSANARYANNVLHNANINAEQARNWINYAGNQREMAETLKAYQRVLALAEKTIEKISSSARNFDEKSCIILYQGKSYGRACSSLFALKDKVRDILDTNEREKICQLQYKLGDHTLELESEQDFEEAPVVVEVTVSLVNEG